jgi:ribosome-binding protein aMBF1 (putative translation factor)
MLSNDVNSGRAREMALTATDLGPRRDAEMDRDHARRRGAAGSESAYREARRRIERIDGLVVALDERRKALGMSTAELARRTRLAPEVVRGLFSVGGLNPSIGTLMVIADALELELIARPCASDSGAKGR